MNNSKTTEELKQKFLAGRSSPAAPQTPANPTAEEIKAEQHIQDLQSIIQRDLPDWKLAESSIEQIHQDAQLRATQTARQQFQKDIQAILDRDMPGWVLSSFSLTQIETLPDYHTLTTFKVAPQKQSQFEKVVDLRDGKVFMSQG